MDLLLSKDSHDLVIEEGVLRDTASYNEYITQKLKIRLQNDRGEWFRDVNNGIPYSNEILGYTNTKELADTFIIDTILSTEGVSSISDYSSVVKNKDLTVRFRAVLENGAQLSFEERI
ncbi:hypothetical protein [Pseudoalteromonas phage J2-1_QLiu-2017]|nr:hypothetical protein [Pseudoalteromonas phage J2-1_QLiu-2017]